MENKSPITSVFVCHREKFPDDDQVVDSDRAILDRIMAITPLICSSINRDRFVHAFSLPCGPSHLFAGSFLTISAKISERSKSSVRKRAATLQRRRMSTSSPMHRFS